MKKVLRLLSVCLIVFLVFSSMVLTESSGNEDTIVYAMGNDIVLMDEEVDFYKTQSESIEEYQSILDYFNSLSKVRINNGQCYDDNYGGAYIDEQGELVVLLVDCDNSSKECIRTVTSNQEIEIKDCTYSFNELLTVIYTINDNLEYLKANGIVVSEMYENVYENKVMIGIEKHTDEAENIIRSIIDKPFMEIHEKTEKLQNEVSVSGGNEIQNSTYGGYSTLGFCARKDDGTYGFVVSGHACNNLYDNFTLAGTSIGYVTKTAYYDNSTADAAFLTKTKNASTTYYIDIYACHYLAEDISDLPVGALVYKYGIGSQLTSGRILSNYYTVTPTGSPTAILQTTADYYSEGGDSGGPVFMIMDVVNGSITCKLLGINKGHTDEFSAFSKYYYIADELGITAITY